MHEIFKMLEKIYLQGERMSQQLTDLQNAVSALQAEDTILVAAVSSAVTNLLALEAQVAALGANNDTAGLESLATSVNKITSDLTAAVAQIAAVPAPAPTPTPVVPVANSTPAPVVPPAAS